MHHGGTENAEEMKGISNVEQGVLNVEGETRRTLHFNIQHSLFDILRFISFFPSFFSFFSVPPW